MAKWSRPLPYDLQEASKCVHPDILKSFSVDPEKRDESVQKLALKLISQEYNKQSVEAFLERKQSFFKYQKKRVLIPKNNKRSLSNSKKRELGLYSLPQNTITYEEALPIHHMWLEYIKAFLPLKNLKPNVEQRLKFFKIDYIGALIKVTRSKCPSLVGQSGIVIFETKFTFKIVCEDNKAKTIPKCSCVFSVTVDKLNLSIFGNYFAVRPAERINKKHKTKMVFDL